MTNDTTTDIAVREGGAAALFGRVSDPVESAMRLADVLQRSKIMGVENPGDALAVTLTCMAEGITPIEFSRTYHVIGGRLSMRADAMLAAFLRLGGKHRWIESDDHKATIELSIGDESVTNTYTIEDAQRAKLVKDDSGWVKNPRQMLRARASSEAVRMIRPQIVAGVYAPEEIEGVEATATPVRTTEEVARRRDELQSTSGRTATTEDVVDATIETASEPPAVVAESTESPAASDVPADATAPITREQLDRIATLCQQLEIEPQTFVAQLKEKTGIDHPKNLTAEQAATVVANLEKAATVPF